MQEGSVDYIRYKYYMLVKDVKVFDKNSFRFNILNSEDGLIEILTNAPIVGDVNGEETVIGFIENPYTYNRRFFGDVFIYPQYLEFAKCSVVSQEITFDTSEINMNDIVIKEIIIHVKS